MTLDDLCDIKTEFPEADFWLVRRGGVKDIGKPTREYSEYAIGIKIKEEAKEILDPKYLFYMMMHIHNTGYFQQFAVGATNLVSLRSNDVKKIKLG